MSEPKSKAVTVVLVGFIVTLFVVFLATGGVQNWKDTAQIYKHDVRAKRQKSQLDFMGEIHQKVINDAVAQYEITKRSGAPVDAYIHAGIVAEAYLQAKDEANYQKWKNIAAQEDQRFKNSVGIK